MHLNRKMKVIYSSLSLDFNACGGPWIQFVLPLNGPNHSTVTLLSRLMLFQWPNSWKIYSRMILVLSPCSLMVGLLTTMGMLACLSTMSLLIGVFFCCFPEKSRSLQFSSIFLRPKWFLAMHYADLNL